MDLTGVSCACTASDGLPATVNAFTDLEALATHDGETASNCDADYCLSNTGFEHCTECDMPSIQNLVTSLLDIMEP